MEEYEQETKDCINETEQIEQMIRDASKEIENIFYYLGCDVFIKKNENSENLFET